MSPRAKLHLKFRISLVCFRLMKFVYGYTMTIVVVLMINCLGTNNNITLFTDDLTK